MSRDLFKDRDRDRVAALSRVRAMAPLSTASLRELEPIIGGRYRIGHLVGRGSFAHVYRATHVTIPSIVYAVKVLRRGPSEDPSLRERFRLEAEAASSIRSPHIAPVIDFGETRAGLPFLVMPLLVGLPCDRLLLQVGCLRPPDVARFSLDVLDALEVAHDRGVIHRDLKPSNIFIEQAPAGRHPMAKVLDFGIAKLLEESSLAPVTATAVNSFVGTPAFASPEALSGEPDPRGDLYAFGHAMANMLDGRAPYEDEKTQALAIQRHLSAEPVPLGDNSLRSGLAEVIARACEKSALNRFQTASDMAEAIRATGLDQIEVPPLEFVPDDIPESNPDDELATDVHRMRPPAEPQSSSSVQRVGLASTLGPAETPAEPHPLASEAGSALLGSSPLDSSRLGSEDDTQPDGLAAAAARTRARWRPPWAVLALLGSVAGALALAIGPGEPARERPEPSQAPVATLPVASEPVVEVPPISPAPAIRRASLAVARASRVELDNLVDLAGAVDGVEAWLGDARLGLLPLRGAYVPRTRPLTFRFVGDGFELTHVVEQAGPVVHRVEAPTRRHRRRHTARDGAASPAAVTSPAPEAPPATTATPASPEGPRGGPSVFGPPRTDLRNPFE